jgi:flagellar assembly protein FliH
MNTHARSTSRTQPQHKRGLFAEDFDAPAGITNLDEPEGPEEIAPSFAAEAVEAAREEGFADGYSRGLSQAAQDRAEIARQLLASIAERMAAANEAARQAAEDSAAAVADLLMTTLGQLFPALCARHGGGEVAAVAASVLPSLDGEAAITLRVSPHVVEELEAELARLDADLRARITVLATDAVAPGDVRIGWGQGGARRDAAALWADVASVLARYGIDVSASVATRLPVCD